MHILRLNRRGTMKFNRRGIVLNFLIAVLIAIIILVPTVLFASELFRVSDQAKDNFKSLVKELQEFAQNSLDTQSKPFLLIMDEESSIILYKEKKKEFAFLKEKIRRISGVVTRVEITENNYYLPFPQQKCGEVPCLCLCRKFAFDEAAETESKPVSVEEVLSKQVSLEDLLSFREGRISKEKGISYAAQINTYDVACELLLCEEISNLPLASSSTFYRGVDDLRRSTITFENKEGKISLRKQ